MIIVILVRVLYETVRRSIFFKIEKYDLKKNSGGFLRFSRNRIKILPSVDSSFRFTVIWKKFEFRLNFNH